MKVPPKHPHFFKPIIPGFKNGIKIPLSFLKYLEGHEYAILRRNGKEWRVKLNGRIFEEGWTEFAEEHDLEVGYVLVFRHEGNMEFEVTIFDASQCNTKYVEHQQESANKSDMEERAIIIEESLPLPNVEAAKDMHLGPHFICIMRSYYISNSFLLVPKSFARENGLSNRKCMITIRDDQRPWTFSLYFRRKSIYIGGGWDEFCLANGLKEGDCAMFEIVATGESPILKFHAEVTEKSKPNVTSPDDAYPDVEAAKDAPHFITTIRPYCIPKSTLYVPNAFACKNGLSNRRCTIMIKDEERQWEFRLCSSTAGRTFIGGDWRSFCAANFLKVGECVMFKIYAKEEKPTLKFYDLRGNASHQPKGKKTNTDTRRVSKQDPRGNAPLQRKGKKTNLEAASVSSQGQRTQTSNMTAPKAQVPASTSANANPHFISAIQPYSISQDFFYLPLPFAKANGLFDRHCEMILMNEQLRLWSVRLRPMSHHVGISGGWSKFRDANDLQVGDTFKFELFSNDNVLVVYFHCRYAGKDAPGIRKAIDKVMKQLLMGKAKEH